MRSIGWVVLLAGLFACSGPKPTAARYAACAPSLTVQELLDNTNETLQEIRAYYVDNELRGTPQGERVLREFNQIYDVIYEREMNRLQEACQRAHVLADSLR